MVTILRFPNVRTKLGLSRSSIYDLVSKKLLPRPVRLGQRIVGFPENELEAVIAARIAGADDEQIRALVSKIHANRNNISAAGA